MLDRAVQSWLQHMSVEKGLSRNTLSNYRRDINRYLSWLHKNEIKTLEEITEDTVEKYFQDIQIDQELSVRSANRALVVVRQFHAFCLREDWVHSNVAKDIKPRKTGQHLPDTLSIDEVNLLIESCTDQRERALLELLYGTGARISEILALDVDDFYRAEGLLVLTGKGNKQRVVPIGRMAKEAVDAYVNNQRTQLVRVTSPYPHRLFLNNLGRPLSRQTAWALIQKIMDRSGCNKKISPHTFRHSFATHMLEGGADIRVVQELLGHASITTTQIYTHITNDEVRRVHALYHPRA